MNTIQRGTCPLTTEERFNFLEHRNMKKRTLLKGVTEVMLMHAWSSRTTFSK